jgi:hypothetical protein
MSAHNVEMNAICQARSQSTAKKPRKRLFLYLAIAALPNCIVYIYLLDGMAPSTTFVKSPDIAFVMRELDPALPYFSVI